MTEEQIALARRAIACKGWRWMPGMLVVRESGWAEMSASRVPCTLPNGGYADALPDLTDPATLGCLLALVRRAHGHLWLHLSYKLEKGSMSFSCYFPRPMPWVASEEEALVAALEAAP